MIRLLYNYYEDKNPVRKKEIDFCLQKNLENQYINTIIIDSAEKLTYSFFFNKINEITGPDDINIVCNSDIFFDDTILLTSNLKNHEAYALSRWDYFNVNKCELFDRQDSQDTWIVRGQIKNVISDFTLGRKGCDNRIAYELAEAGYNPKNPSKSIKTYHFHTSNIRNYSHHDTIHGKYRVIPVTSL